MKIYYTEIRQIKTTLIEAHTVGSKGWRSGESARLPPMLPGSKSRLRLHMWVEFVVGALSCSKRFFSGYSGFPLSSKTNICEFKFNKESGRLRTTLWMCYLIFIYLFIYLYGYSQTPLYGHLLNLDSSHYYGQFALSLGE